MGIEHIERVDSYLDSPDGFAKLEGWMPVEKAKRLARLVAGIQPEVESPLAIELGVWGGRGVLTMGLALKHCLGRGKAYGVDPYSVEASLEGRNTIENDDWWSKVDYEKILAGVIKKIDELQLIDHVGILRERSQDVAHLYKLNTIDVLHQDSNHSELISTFEVSLFAPKLKPGGYWIIDDIHWETTQKAQRMLSHRFSLVEEHREHQDKGSSWAIYQKPI